MKLMQAFYDANDASNFDKSISYFLPDATVTTWGEGVNGRHWQEQTHTGAEEIRQVLVSPGFHRASPQEGYPNYTMENIKVTSGQISLWLRPDRLSPIHGRPYDPYHVVATITNGEISKMTVTEFLSWE